MNVHNLTPAQIELVRAHVASNNDIEPSEVSDERVFYYVDDAPAEMVQEFLESLEE